MSRGKPLVPKLPATLPRKGNGQGRSQYSAALAEQVLTRYATGESMDSIMAALHFSRHGLDNWCERLPAFAEALARARRLHADARVDLAGRIADDSTLDLLDQGDGRRIPNSAAVARAKLRTEYNWRLAGLLDPSRWGEKTMLTGADGVSSPFATGGEYDMGRLSPDEAVTLAMLIDKMRKPVDADGAAGDAGPDGADSIDAEPVTSYDAGSDSST